MGLSSQASDGCLTLFGAEPAEAKTFIVCATTVTVTGQ